MFFNRLPLLLSAAVVLLSACTNIPTQSPSNGSTTSSIETSAQTTTQEAPLNSDQESSTLAEESSNSPESTDSTPTLAIDTNLAQTDLWPRIRNGFAMRKLDSNLIARQEKWYTKHPEYVARMLERSHRYLYYIAQEVDKRGMPMEIALLPMIESAFNPSAYSNGNASGIWQFIPSTGKNFGLQQNWWYDGRRDIVSATNSALDYLQKLHDQFGDWQLALAAYNCGEGAVERAQKRNRRLHKPTDYSHLRLPRETRNYVPKLMAAKHIIDDPAKFGLTLPAIPDRPYFASVSTDHHIDVKLAAELAEISMEEFKALNPAHDRPVILQRNGEVILLPVDKVETFHSNLEACTEPLVTWQAYQSKKGERLDKLAPRFGLSAKKLKSVNGLSQHAKFSNGQTLLVPLNGEEADVEFEAFNTKLPPSLNGNSLVHIVRRGETLGGIAHRYHVSVASLKRQNRNSTLIHQGQRLVVAGAAVPSTTGSTKTDGEVHIVRKGETLFRIARQYHVSPASLKRLNGNTSLIHPGQRLTIRNVNVASNP